MNAVRCLLLAILSPAVVNASPALVSIGAGLNEAVQGEEFSKLTSVIVSVDGKLVYESYWGEGSVEHLNDTRSAMKSLTAMAIGAALDDGLLDSLETPVWALFKSDAPVRFDSKVKQQITVLDLLSMSSALDCDDNVWETPGNEEHMYPARSWLFFALDLPVRENYVRDSQGLGPFAYCTVGSFLLGQVIQKLSGKPVDRYIESRLLQPLGIESVDWPRSPIGEVMTGGGARINSRGLLRLGELVLNDGAHNGKALLSNDWTRAMTEVHRTVNERQHYGLQWWKETYRCGERELPVWLMSGNGGNKVAVIRQLGTVAVVTATLYGTKGMHEQSADVLQRFVLDKHPACMS